jgi:hypothetical protein
MIASTFTNSISFHFRHAWFNIKEQFSDIPSALAANALIPFFVWVLSRVWERFNAHLGQYQLHEIVVYIGITELLFMTFVRLPSLNRASGDFSIALARPRSWLVTSFSGLVGRSLGSRIFMLVLLFFVLPILGAQFELVIVALLRLIILLPWLGLIQGMFSLFFANAQVLWHQTNYFLLPFGKIFLVMGGVWGPVSDFSEPWKDIILKLPPADLFFQPAYFCIKGEFYQITFFEWLMRTSLLILVLWIINIYFFSIAKNKHQSFGG